MKMQLISHPKLEQIITAMRVASEALIDAVGPSIVTKQLDEHAKFLSDVMDPAKQGAPLVMGRPVVEGEVLGPQLTNAPDGSLALVNQCASCKKTLQNARYADPRYLGRAFCNRWCANNFDGPSAPVGPDNRTSSTQHG